MAKQNLFTIIGAIFAIIIMVAVFAPGKEKYDESRAGETARVVYEVLNLRDEPDGEVIGQIYSGSYVTLTGNTMDFLMMSENGSWSEISYKGTTAWVVTQAVRVQ